MVQVFFHLVVAILNAMLCAARHIFPSTRVGATDDASAIPGFLDAGIWSDLNEFRAKEGGTNAPQSHTDRHRQCLIGGRHSLRVHGRAPRQSFVVHP